MIIKDFLSDLGLELFSDGLKNQMDELRIRKEIIEFVQNRQELTILRNSQLSDLDYEGYLEYIRNHMIDEMKEYVCTVDYEKSEKLKQMILEKALSFEKKEGYTEISIRFITENCIDILKSYYLSKLEVKDRVLAHMVVQTIINHFGTIMGIQRMGESGSPDSCSEMKTQDFKQKGNGHTEGFFKKNRLNTGYLKKIALGIALVLCVSLPAVYSKKDDRDDKEKNKKEDTIKDEVEYTYEDVTPLYLADYEFEDTVKAESRRYEKLFESGYEKGCVLKAYLTNKKTNVVTVSGVTLVVDEVSAIEEARPVILGYVLGQELYVYILNDGNAAYEGEIRLKFKYYNESKQSEDFVDEKTMEEILNTQLESKTVSLESGEITRLGKYKVSSGSLYKWMENNKRNPGIYILGIAEDQDTGKTKEVGLGCLYSSNESHVNLLREQGDDSENTVIDPFLLEVDEHYPKEFSAKESYNIESMDAKNIQMILLPDRSCTVQFHAVIEIAGEEPILTSTFRERIQVPLYKNEPNNLYSEVVSYLAYRDIEHYYYNEDITIQKNIAYDADSVLGNSVEVFEYDNVKKDSFNVPDSIVQDYPRSLENPEINTDDSDTGINANADLMKNEIREFEDASSFSDVLQEYYNAAENHFSNAVIESSQFLNKGVCNFSNQDIYSVYYRYEDLEEDGSSELLISINEKETNKNIIDIFAIVDGSLVRVIQNSSAVGAQCRYYLCNDNRIKNECSISTINSFVKYYQLNARELVFLDSFIYDGSNGDKFTHIDAAGNEKIISMEQYDNIWSEWDVNYDDRWELLYEGRSVHYVE